MFCCESGTHVVDPEQSYYKGISYRAGTEFHNISKPDGVPLRDPDAACLDSSQAWFCRDLWVRSAQDAMAEVDQANNAGEPERRAVVDVAARDPLMEGRDAVKVKAAEGGDEEEIDENAAGPRPPAGVDADANVGSDYDAMPDEEDIPPIEPPKLSIPNSVFMPARILVNPRCATTYAGVSHTQLAFDLFGDGEDPDRGGVTKYVLDEWEGAPESFVCQEQRYVRFTRFRII